MTININVSMELSAADITAISEADRRSELDHEIKRQIRGQIRDTFESRCEDSRRKFEEDCARMEAEYNRRCAEMHAQYEHDVAEMEREHEEWKRAHGLS